MGKNIHDLKNVTVSFDPNSGAIRLRSKDPRIKNKPFNIEVPTNSPTYDTLYEMLGVAGIEYVALPPNRMYLNAGEVVEFSKEHRNSEIFVGMKGHEEPCVFDLEAVPHTLIVGTVGGGKSVLQRAIHTSAAALNSASVYAFGKIPEVLLHLENTGGKVASNPEKALANITELAREVQARRDSNTPITDLRPIYVTIDEYADFATDADFSAKLDEILNHGGEVCMHVFVTTQRLDGVSSSFIGKFSRRVAAGNYNRSSYERFFGTPSAFRSGLLNVPGRAVVSTNGHQELFQIGFSSPKEEEEVFENALAIQPLIQ